MDGSLQKFGALGEDQALLLLKGKGYRWLASNYRARSGEIDLVMDDNGTLVFVEVKKRSGTNYGAPEEAVTRIKQRHLTRAAYIYLQREGFVGKGIRFDVVSLGPEGVRHIENAFLVGNDYYF